MEGVSGNDNDDDESSRLQKLQFLPDMSTPAVTTPVEVTTTANTVPVVAVVASLVDPANNRRSPPEKVAGNVRHASMPHIDSRPRRLQETTITVPKSGKEQTVQQQRQQYGRSNSTTAATAAERSVHRVGGGGGGGAGGVGTGFKSKLRNSFRSTAKRIRQQQSAIDALAKNSQMLGLHNLQDSPRTMQAQRTIGRVSAIQIRFGLEILIHTGLRNFRVITM